MLNVHCVALTFLLASCAALTGSIPSIAFLAYMLLLRPPDAPVRGLVLWLIITTHIGIAIASLLLSLAASTSDDLSNTLFGNDQLHNALRIAGFYGSGAGSVWKYVASVVPELITGMFALAARKRLCARPKPGATRIAAKKYSIYWALLFWAVLCGTAALFVCSVVGGIFYVFAVVISSSMVFIGTNFTSKDTVASLGFAGTLMGSILICTWSVVQNYGSWSYFGGALTDTVGLKVFCNFVEIKDGRCLVQYFLGLVATMCAHVMTHIAHHVEDHRAQHRRPRSMGAGSASEGYRGSYPPHGGTSAFHQIEAKQTSSAPRLSERLLRSQGDQHPVSRGAAPHIIVPPGGEGQHLHAHAPDVDALSSGKASLLSFFGSTDVVAVIMRLFRYLATWIMTNFIVLPLFPLMCLVADLIAFPSLPTLALLPLVFCGLLKPSWMHAAMPFHIALEALLFTTQYYVFASADRGVSFVTKLFLSETRTGWQLLEVGVNLVAYSVLLATYEQQKRFGSKQARAERKQQKLDEQRKEEALLMRECVEQRPVLLLGMGGGAEGRQRSASHASNALPLSREGTREMGEPSRSNSAIFDVDEEGRLAIEEDETTFLERSIALLGEDRVRRIQLLLAERTGSGSRETHCFYRLTKRMPTEEELHALRRSSDAESGSRTHLMHNHCSRNEFAAGPPDDPVRCVLRRRRVQAALPTWRQLIHDLSILLNHYSLNLTILFTFVAGSCVQQMDVVHGFVLVLFVMYYLLSSFARRSWWFLVLYMSALTIFEVVFTFVDKFVEIDYDEYVLPGVHAHTIGLVPMPSRWSAICYFAVLFFVCGQLHLLKVSSISWDELFTLYEWRRLIRVPAVRTIRQRLTLAIAAAVFVALGIFERRSLIVQIFLLFFLVICIFTAGFPRVSFFGCVSCGGTASPKLLWNLWLAASVYSAIVMLLVSLYQFSDIAAHVDHVLSSIPGCDRNQTTSCQEEIGIVAPSGYVLTYFLAPWFIALVTAVAHMSSVSKNAVAVQQEEKSQRLNRQSVSLVVASTKPVSPTTRTEKTMLLEHRALSLGDEMATVRNEKSSGDTSDDEPLSPLLSPRLFEAAEPPLGYAPTLVLPAPQLAARLSPPDEDPSGMLAAARRFSAPDQKMFVFVVWCVKGVEALADVLWWFGHEYGSMLVWSALYVAATTEYTLMASVYAVFLLFDWSSIASLVYCVVHLTALYAYQFSFTPRIDGTWNGVDWAELIGLIKNNSQEMNAVGPVLVFFAVLYRFKTSVAVAVATPNDAAVPSSRLSSTLEHSRAVLMNGRAVSWLSFFHHQGLHIVGYEVFVTLCVLNLKQSVTTGSGAVIGALLILTMLTGRAQFFSSRFYQILLQLGLFLLCVYHISVRINAQHHMWNVPSDFVDNGSSSGDHMRRAAAADEWEHWVGTGSVAGMFYSFASMVVLHMLRNKRQYVKTNASDERVEKWVQRNLYQGSAELVSHITKLLADEARVESMLADGMNLLQPQAKRRGNVLKHSNCEKLEEFIPEIPNTLDDSGAPIVSRPASPLVATSPNRSDGDAPASNTGANDSGNSPQGATEERKQQHRTPFGSINESCRDLHMEVHRNQLLRFAPPPPPHLLYYDAMMTFCVRAVAFASPVAIFSFAAGTIFPSILCTLLMVGGMLQFAYREQLHWKFYRLWPKVLVAYIVVLIVMPIFVNLPPIGNWAVDNNTISAILGIVESGLPAGINGTHAALIFVLALQSRIYEEFWFERVIRAMRSDLRKRSFKHKELMELIAHYRRKDVEAADKRDHELREKLRLVRQMYGGIQFETATGDPDPNASLASTATMRRQQTSLLPAGSFVAGSFTSGGTKIVDETTLKSQGAASSPLAEASRSLTGPATDELAASYADLAGSKRATMLPRLSLRDTLLSSRTENKADSDASSAAVDDPAAPDRDDVPPAEEARAGTTGKDDAAAAAPTEEEQPYKPTRFEKLQEYCLTATDIMLEYSFNPPKRRVQLLLQGRYHPLLCPLIAAVRVCERHTAQFVALLAVGNFIQSGTAWDALPGFLVVTIISVYDPFAPLRCYEWLGQFVVLGIVIKAIILVLVAHITMADGLVDFLNWFMITGDGTTKLGAVDTSSSSGEGPISAYGDLIFDFFVFAMIVVHKHLSYVNGVYSEEDRVASLGAGSLFSRVLEGVTGTADDTASPNNVEDTSPKEFPAIRVSDSTDDYYQPPTPVSSTPNAQGYLLIPSASPPANAEPELAENNDDAEAEAPVAPQVEQGPSLLQITKTQIQAFIDNATSVRGTGSDLYVYYFLAEVVGLLILTFSYYSIAGNNTTNGSIVKNVQDNMLPGPFVVALICSLVAMVIDRMLYAGKYLRGKLAFHIVYSIILFVLFCVWINVLDPAQRGAGMTFFCFKSLYLYLSCWQLRWGFPYHRRHDPFTQKPNDLFPWLGYQLFRAIPFLWELRVVSDWSVSPTALRLECYLKVENIYDTVYERFVSIGDAQGDQPHFGGLIYKTPKVTRGLVRVVIILFAVTFPLLYYSTFNPAMGANDVSQVDVDVTFESSAPFFSSTILSTVATQSGYPQLAQWLSITRPMLGSNGITESQKKVQLIDLSSCSSNLWSVSPQGLRLLSYELNATYFNETTMMMNLQLQMTRGGGVASTSSSSAGDGSSGGSDEETLRHPWSVPWNTAGEILQAIQNASSSSNDVNDSAVIMLPNFYSPFVFNQPADVQFYPSISGGTNADNVRCSIVLRSELDVLTNARVRYWCLKCDALFSEGNHPNSTFPEWNCLTGQDGCGPYNFESLATVKKYFAVPMYYVFFSDPIPHGLSFLPNIGIIAIYTTFVLALGRVFRGMFSTSAANIAQTDMADPTPVANLIEYIAIARACSDYVLEQSVYYELVDLLRSPERLLHVTGMHKKRYRSVDEGGGAMPVAA